MREISVLSTKILPPGSTASSYLSSEGKFMATRQSGFATMGEPTGVSLIMIEQFAVPPRISGP